MRIILILLALMATAADASDFESRYYASVFAGDLSWVSDAVPETPAGSSLKTKFNDRFLRKIDNTLITELDDPLVRAIVRRYFEYWRQALLAPQEREDAEHRLHSDIARLVESTGLATDAEDIDSALTSVLAERGFNFRGGRTQPLLDFMLWRTIRTVEFDVELTDVRQAVTVHFLDDFVIRGWSHFATFGRSGTGGWADRDALYCVSVAYDVDSEQFENSYLRHEARHFADYTRFPALEATDLEYRGKLTELAFSTHALQLLRGFWRHSSETSTVPHPFANWHVVHNIATTLDASCEEDPLTCLKSAPNEELQATARHLLVEHTKILEEFGSETIDTAFKRAAPE